MAVGNFVLGRVEQGWGWVHVVTIATLSKVTTYKIGQISGLSGGTLDYTLCEHVC